jgi:hypothetical protein
LYPGYFFRASVILVNLNGEGFFIVVRKNKCPGNTGSMWGILINPSRFPEPGKSFPEDDQERCAKDLRLISDEVHAVLARTSGVTRLRWWFFGWDVNRPGVRTPSQLPWRVDVPELTDAENRKMS